MTFQPISIAPIAALAPGALVTLFLLGAFHGVNPAMGWLFAVAKGMQERSRAAVLRAFLPLTIGHGVAMAVAALVLVPASIHLPPLGVRLAVAAVLVGFGVRHLVRARHPHWGGMRVGFAGLAFWSFLVASAHGAGLMLAPVLLRVHAGHEGHADHARHLADLKDGAALWALGIGVHTLGFLVAMVLAALLVYEKLGLAVLRRAWFNLDLVWAVVLVVAGVATPFV